MVVPPSTIVVEPTVAEPPAVGLDSMVRVWLAATLKLSRYHESPSLLVSEYLMAKRGVEEEGALGHSYKRMVYGLEVEV